MPEFSGAVAAVVGTFAWVLLGVGGGNEAAAQSDVGFDLRAVRLVQEFVPDGDPGQCNGAASGRIVSAGDQFSPDIRIDTDNRPGGCQYRIGIVDPSGQLAQHGFHVWMRFAADGDRRQCGNQGTYDIPVSRDLTNVQFTPAIRIDTGKRPGGCPITWSTSGWPLVVLEVRFAADGDPRQCLNTGTHSTADGTVTVHLNTDNRPGGCRLSLRLVRAS
jgi:hypothetical protein